MAAVVLRGDALALPLADDSVDLVVTSPPYFGLRSYQDGGEHYAGQIGSEATPAEFVDALLAATREMVRVVKPSGSIWVNLGDKYAGVNIGTTSGHKGGSINASVYDRHIGQGRETRDGGVRQKSLLGIPWRYALRCIDDLGLILRAEIIWSKPNGLPESVTDRVRRSHETWFHFTLEPRYFSAVDEIREQYDAKTAQRYAAGYGTKRQLTTAQLSKNTDYYVDDLTPNPLGKLPGSVWTIATQPLTVPPELGVDHFAAFPMEWPRRIILGWSPCGGVVLDPFGGTGTTALVAEVLGRRGVSVDMSADYCRLARWRTTDLGERARALHVPKPAPQVEGQASLFDALEA